MMEKGAIVSACIEIRKGIYGPPRKLVAQELIETKQNEFRYQQGVIISGFWTH